MADKPDKSGADVKDYIRDYTFDKEHKEAYKNLMNAYSIKDRKTDNRTHHAGIKDVLKKLESLESEIEDIEHEDHLYKTMGKVLHMYENSKAEHQNKTAKTKFSKLDYNEVEYTDRARQLIQAISEQSKTSVESMINDIKEGNVEAIVNQILGVTHNSYQAKKAMHKMREALPPNKDKDFYFKMANFMASKRQEDYTATDLRKMSVDRDTLLTHVMRDYDIAKENELKKMKPKPKKK